jgi:hypothetical protein
VFIVSCSFRLQNFLYFPCHRLYHLLFATLINRTFLLFLRHENPSICILGVHHAVLVVSVVVVVVVVVMVVSVVVLSAVVVSAVVVSAVVVVMSVVVVMLD